jgi:hypothetical protein
MRYSAIAAASSLLVICVACVPAARAAELASYTFDNTRASADAEPNSTAGDFVDGQRVVSSYSVLGTPAPSLAVNYAQIDGTSEAAAVAANDYVAFTITPQAGYDLDLSSLTYSCIGGAPSFGPMTFFLRSSVDGFAATLDTVTRTNQFPTGRTIDLTGPSFQNLATATTFRVYLYDGGNNSTDDAGRVDSVVLNGTVAVVPEPSVLSLLALTLTTATAARLPRRPRRRRA